MRALLVLTIVAAFATVAFGQTVATTQDQAKTLRDFWKNCSQIVRGRLGALANTEDPTNPNGLIIHSSNTNFTVTYSPCAATNDADYMGYFLRTSFWANDTAGVPQQRETVFTMAATPDRVVEFFMPTQKGDVAHFVGTYVATSIAGHASNMKYFDNAIVTTNCGEGDNVVAEIQGRTLSITLTNMNACARFPYTNEAMPAGAIAALIVVIICFVLQFAVCGWYHKTYSHDAPFSAGREDAPYQHE